MKNVKKLISLSLYLNKNYLIKESSYLKSLIKESGYDWKEMGKAPHLKKDEPYKEEETSMEESPKENLDQIKNKENDSWLENSSYEVSNEPGEYGLNIIEDEKEEKSDIDPGMLVLLKEKMSYLTEESMSNFRLLTFKEYRKYAKYIAEQLPFQFLIWIDKNERYLNIFNKEKNIAINSIFSDTKKANEILSIYFDGVRLEQIVYMLGKFAYVILGNKKLLEILMKDEKRYYELHRFFDDHKEEMEQMSINYDDLKQKHFNSKIEKEETIKLLERVLEYYPERFNEKWFTDILEEFLQKKKISREEINEYSEKARKAILDKVTF